MEETKKTLAEELAEMKDKAYVYQDEEVVVLQSAYGVGDYGDMVEIYLNNGKTIECTIGALRSKMKQFQPIGKQVVIHTQAVLNKVSTLQPNVVGELRESLLDQIRRIRTNPSKEVIEQSKQVFQGVNTFANLAKVELEYRKYIES